MKDLADILCEYEKAPADAELALATVVRVDGSAYRRPPARMLILPGGRVVGGVSGGCLERDVLRRSGGVIASGKPTVVRYESANDFDIETMYRLGCGGTIDVLIEPLVGKQGSQLMGWLRAGQDATQVIVTVAGPAVHPLLGQHFQISREGILMGGDAETLPEPLSANLRWAAGKALEQRETISLPSLDATVDMLAEYVQPALRLLIFGAGADVLPLVSIGKSLGWRVQVIDVRSGHVDPDRQFGADGFVSCDVDSVADRVSIPARTAAVVMTHNFSHDARLLNFLARQPLIYLGLLGARHRTGHLLERLSQRPDQLHSPVGLNIGADNPQEIALAIAAQITANLHGRET